MLYRGYKQTFMLLKIHAEMTKKQNFLDKMSNFGHFEECHKWGTKPLYSLDLHTYKGHLSRLLLSNQDKGCTPSVVLPLALPLGPALHNLSTILVHRKMQYNKIPIRYGLLGSPNTKNLYFEKTKLLSVESFTGYISILYLYGLQS